MNRKRRAPTSSAGLFGAPTPRADAPSTPSPAEPPSPPTADSAFAGAQPPGRVSVSQLAVLIQRAMQDHLPTGLKVLGEVSQFRERTHWYFDLKDDAAVVSCVMFASAARKAGFTPEVGQLVVVTGRVEFYAKQGRTTFMVDRIEPVGAGALEIAFRRLCGELKGLGWFAEERKRPPPLFPRRVAIITSRTGAALQDVLDTFQRRCPAVELALVDVRVQGDGAAAEVANAIRRLSDRHADLGIDAILVTRGGGSREDLWTFNERIVAQAIVESRVPVVAAIGHETDVTIAELVADARAATPTQAAMRLAPDADALRRQLQSLGSRLSTNLVRQVRHDHTRASESGIGLRSAIRARLADARARLDSVSAGLERHRPVAIYAQRHADLRRAGVLLDAAISSRLVRVDLDLLSERLIGAMQRSLGTVGDLASSLERGLELVGPLGVLRRGYSVTLAQGGRVVRSVGDVAPGESITTRVADGSFDSVVGQHGTAMKFAPLPDQRTPRPSSRRATKPPDPDQPGLF